MTEQNKRNRETIIVSSVLTCCVVALLASPGALIVAKLSMIFMTCTQMVCRLATTMIPEYPEDVEASNVS